MNNGNTYRASCPVLKSDNHVELFRIKNLFPSIPFHFVNYTWYPSPSVEIRLDHRVRSILNHCGEVQFLLPHKGDNLLVDISMISGLPSYYLLEHEWRCVVEDIVIYDDLDNDT